MQEYTRVQVNGWLDRQGELNGIADPTAKFSVDPSVQQKLIDKRQESSEFLSQINIIPVSEMQGDLLGLGIGGPIASNTDTSGAGTRKTVDPTGLDAAGYHCRQNNSDTHLTYAKLDAWAKFPDFQTRIQSQIVKRQALDNMLIGFNGTSFAATSNPVTYPNREDVNKCWLQYVRDNRPTHVVDEGDKVAGELSYGPNGDYATLDALVYDLVNSHLPSWVRGDTMLRAMTSHDLLNDKYFPLINKERDPSEELARDVIMASKRLGGLPIVLWLREHQREVIQNHQTGTERIRFSVEPVDHAAADITINLPLSEALDVLPNGSGGYGIGHRPEPPLIGFEALSDPAVLLRQIWGQAEKLPPEFWTGHRDD